MENKKAQTDLIIYFAIFIIGIMLVSFIAVVGGGLLTYAFDQVNTAVSGLGMAGNSNLTYIVDVSFGTLNTTIQQLTWFSGIVALLGTLSILILAYYIRQNPSKILVALFLFIAFLIIILSIFLSDAYNSIITQTDDIATELLGNTIGTFVLSNLPMIMSVIIFIGGIILFSGITAEDYI